MKFATRQVVRHIPSGKLLIVEQHYPSNEHRAEFYRCAPIDNRYTSTGYTADELEPAPPRKPGAFDLKTELLPRIQGALDWEHMEPADLQMTLSNIACCAGWHCYPDIGYVRKAGEDRQRWARFFLHITQGGGYTGEAHALVYESDAMPSAWLLSICKHVIIDSSTAEGRMRGWHPARCSKCGIDLSVDSGD